jgi:hypothetical protein
MAPKKVMKAMKAVKKTRRNKVAHGEPLWIEEDLFDEADRDEEPLWIEEDRIFSVRPITSRKQALRRQALRRTRCTSGSSV